MAIELLENRLALAIMVDVVDNTNLGTAGSIFVTGHGIPGKAPAGSPPQELRVVGASGGFVQGAVTIAGASWTGTTAKIATSVAHQLKLNNPVYVSGVGEPGYNGVFTVTGVDPGASPTWFEYTVPSALASSSGGAAYLPPLLSSQTITKAENQNGLVTLTLQNTANVPLNSAVFSSGLGGVGIGWNGTGEVTQNASTNPALTSNQFQINVSGASGIATVTNASVRIVSVNPIALASLPGWNAQTKTGKVTLDQNIKDFSAQLVQMVTPAGVAPYPLGITPGTANLTSLNIPPFAVGQQAGTSVVDFLEFYYAGNTGYSTFDLSGVDGFVLPPTLHASSVTTGPQTVGLNTTLSNLSREQIGNAFTAFIGNEPVDVRTTGKFGRLLYDQAVSTNKLTVAPAYKQQGAALTGVTMTQWNNNGTGTNIITCTTTGLHGLVPGQAITIDSSDPQYSGSYTVLSTGLTKNSAADGSQLQADQFQVALKVAPASASATGSVTPTNSGVIAASTATLVVEIPTGTLPAVGTTVQLSGSAPGTFSAYPIGDYEVTLVPATAGLPNTAVYLSAQAGQTFAIGEQTGGGTLATPVFVAPPPVPGNQFYAITAPKDWLANQSVATANADPMVTWWNTTVNNFFKAGNYLNVSIGSYVPTSSPKVSITGIRNSGNQTIFTATKSYAVGDVVTIAGFSQGSWYNQTARIVAANSTSFTIAGTSTPPVTMPAGAIAQLSRAISYTGTYGSTGFNFAPDHNDYPDDGTPAGNFNISFSVDKPTPR
ncbi:MAG: hypothetical protein NTY17_00570, partial [Planctomycetia bacterium]|nr:hypothetical protein [Planctomycetia bacterium]